MTLPLPEVRKSRCLAASGDRRGILVGGVGSSPNVPFGRACAGTPHNSPTGEFLSPGPAHYSANPPGLCRKARYPSAGLSLTGLAQWTKLGSTPCGRSRACEHARPYIHSQFGRLSRVEPPRTKIGCIRVATETGPISAVVRLLGVQSYPFREQACTFRERKTPSRRRRVANRPASAATPPGNLIFCHTEDAP